MSEGFDRYIIKAEVDKTTENSVRVVIYYCDTEKYEYYSTYGHKKNIKEEDVIYRKTTELDGIENLKMAVTVGFGLESGIKLQLLTEDDYMMHITVPLTDEEQDIIRPYLAKALISNK